LIKLFIRKLNKIEAHLQNSTLNDDEISKEIDDFQKKYAAFYKNDLKEKSYKERCNKLYKPQIKSNSTQMVLILVKSDTQNIEKKDKNKIKQIRDFYIGKTEITQRQYQIIMEKNPAKIYGVGDNYPVYNVTWYDAVEFCNKLSEIDSLEKCYTINKKKIECNFEANGYRLPLEAEWEYASRAGSTGPYPFPGDPKKFEKTGLKARLSKNDTTVINTYVIYKGNSPTKTQTPDRVKPNAFGLRNMAGNVAEFCSDIPHDRPFGSIPVTAASEYGNEPFLCEFPGCLQYVFKTIRSVGIVYNDIKSQIVPLVYYFTSSRNTKHLFKSFFDDFKRYPISQTSSSASQCVLDVVLAWNIYVYGLFLTFIFKIKLHSPGVEVQISGLHISFPFCRICGYAAFYIIQEPSAIFIVYIQNRIQ